MPAQQELYRYENRQQKTLCLLLFITLFTLGWPEKQTDCPEILHGYWNYQDELGVIDGIIMKGSSFRIPSMQMY